MSQWKRIEPATAAKLEANSANAQKSTGPRTDEGKARLARYAQRFERTLHRAISELRRLQTDRAARAMLYLKKSVEAPALAGYTGRVPDDLMVENVPRVNTATLAQISQTCITAQTARS